MKSRSVLDLWVNAANVPEHMSQFVQWKPEKRKGGGMVTSAYYPAGTIFEGAEALLRCRTGQAEPADDECAVALNMTEEQRKSLQTEYKMDTLGIRGDDRELFRAGVITGYEKSKDGKMEYIKGPNWQAYQDAKKEADNLEDDI